jgi:hypothetical protein
MKKHLIRLLISKIEKNNQTHVTNYKTLHLLLRLNLCQIEKLLNIYSL